MSSRLPIGVFDSGLGGLTVLKALSHLLPNEDFVYLGDVARLPYGTKSAAVVQKYAESCRDFLRKHEVKLVVVACNTATAMALPLLREKSEIPVFGVIEPGVRAGIAASARKKVLVFATESTVRSDAYRREFARQAPEVSVEQIACPLLVPLAEAGWFEHPITRAVLQTYLSQAKDVDFDTVVMGCTHYPLLEATLRELVGPERNLVHGGPALAEEVRESLRASEMLNPSPQRGKISFYATDHVSQDLPILGALFGERIDFSLVDL